MSHPPADRDAPVLLHPGDPRIGNQAACMNCAAKIVMQLSRTHPDNGANTLLVALDMWVQQGIPPEHQVAAYRAIAQNFEIAAATTEAEARGVSIGPAQGSA